MLIQVENSRIIDVVARLIFFFMKYKKSYDANWMARTFYNDDDYYGYDSYDNIVTAFARHCMPNIPAEKKKDAYQLIIDALATIASDKSFIRKNDSADLDPYYDMDGATLALSELILFTDEIIVVPFCELTPYISRNKTEEDVRFTEKLLKKAAKRNAECALFYGAWQIKQGKTKEGIRFVKDTLNEFLRDEGSQLEDETALNLLDMQLSGMNEPEIIGLLKKAAERNQ